MCVVFFFFQAEDGIRDLVRSRGLGDVYKRQVLAHEREQGLGAFEGGFRTADHDGEAGRLGADLAAGNRRVEIVAAQRIDLLRELLRGHGRNTAHVDDQLALGQALRLSLIHI